MRRRLAILAVITAPIVAAVGCGYPAFMFNGHDAGTGAVGGSGTSASGAGGAATSSSSSSSAGASSGGAACTIGHLVISEVRTRGPGGASDEFTELYNPTEASVSLDGSWTLDAHTLDANIHSYSTRWTGKGLPIPAHGHFLLVGSAFADSINSDDHLAVGLTDAASLRLRHNGVNVDVVCYFHASNPGSAGGFLNVFEYDCAGIALGNPHNDADTTDTDTSIERKPGGGAGNCTDTGNNWSDFVAQAPSTPENRQSAPAP